MYWGFLPVGEVGAPELPAAHPNQDGMDGAGHYLRAGYRSGHGDSGMLTETSTGELKVIGAGESSGEGEGQAEEGEMGEQ